MKILLLGASGCFGTELRNFCNGQNISLVHQSSAELNIIKYDKLEKKITSEKPDVVINSAAKTGLNYCEKNYNDAFVVNSVGPLNLAKLCNKLNITLVQISTMAVFDGKKELPYNEDDLPKPINIYSGSKYLGELFVSSICKKYYIIRFPTLYGQRSNNTKNFVDIVIEKLSKNEELKIATDRIDSPTYAKDAACLLLEIIFNKKKYGIYHLSNEGQVSYYEFVEKIKEILKSNSNITKVKYSDFYSHAFQSSRTALKSNKLKSIRSWDKAIKEYLKS